jgi:hypothetical protein
MDKEQYDAIRAAMRPFFRAGIPIENVIEAVHVAKDEVREEQKAAQMRKEAEES